MNKKIILITLSLLLSGPLVFAGQEYERKSVVDKVSDWKSTVGKTGDEQKRIINERDQRRKIKTEYRDKIADIRNEKISAGLKSQKLQDAKQEYKEQIDDLRSSDEKSY